MILSRKGRWDSTVHSLTSLKNEIWNERSNLFFRQELPRIYSCWYVDYLHFPKCYNISRLILWLAVLKHKLRQVFLGFFRTTS